MNGLVASFSRQTDVPLSFCFIEGVCRVHSGALRCVIRVHDLRNENQDLWVYCQWLLLVSLAFLVQLCQPLLSDSCMLLWLLNTASLSATRSVPDRSTTEWATPQSDAALRPEMQKALQRLHEMPPFAFEREIETGLYRQFSSEEKQILRNAALASRATIHYSPDSLPQRMSLNSQRPIGDR